MTMAKQAHPLGLYLHIPFCRSKCAYCDFYSLSGREDRMDAYTAALERHLIEVAPQAAQHSVDTVYFGGGTPSYLGEKRLVKLLKAVKKHYHVDPHAEITLEANPDSAGDWKALRALRRAGFNRISLGVQSTDDVCLRALGRIHTWQQVQEAVAACRRAKFPDVSLDLIYGLPGQTMEQWEKTLSDALTLQPEHLSCYGLKLEEGTPLYRQRDSLTLPDDEAQADMYLYAVEYLRQNGYEQYEISNFARPRLPPQPEILDTGGVCGVRPRCLLRLRRRPLRLHPGLGSVHCRGAGAGGVGAYPRLGAGDGVHHAAAAYHGGDEHPGV